MSLLPEQRLRLVMVQQRGKKPWYEIIQDFGISKTWFYELGGRFDEEGVEGLRNRTSAPNRVWNRLSKATEDAIITLRERVPLWGVRRIKNLLGQVGIHVCEQTIDNVSKRRGFLKHHLQRRQYRPKELHSDHPNQLWQIDLFEFKLDTGNNVHAVVIIDTYSRFVVGCRLFPDKTVDRVIVTLEEALATYGEPSIVQSDNGSQFAPRRPGGKHRFKAFCRSHGVVHVTIPKGRPQQNGKVERAVQTLLNEVFRVFCLPSLLQAQQYVECYLVFYNFLRPHLGIKNHRPNDLYSRLPLPQVCSYLTRVRNDELRFSTRCV